MKTRPYRPSNGTEGMWFDDQFCSRCVHERGEKHCDILSKTFIFEVGDPDYPQQWVQDDIPDLTGRNIRCTAFLPEDADLELYAAAHDPRQTRLL